MSDDNSWSGWASKKYNSNYNSYVPWLEDKYLSWYGENKTSYTAKGTCSPTPFATSSSSSSPHRPKPPR